MPSRSSFAGHQSHVCILWNKIRETQEREKQFKAQQNSTFYLSLFYLFLI